MYGNTGRRNVKLYVFSANGNEQRHRRRWYYIPPNRITVTIEFCCFNIIITSSSEFCFFVRLHLLLYFIVLKTRCCCFDAFAGTNLISKRGQFTTLLEGHCRCTVRWFCQYNSFGENIHNDFFPPRVTGTRILKINLKMRKQWIKKKKLSFYKHAPVSYGRVSTGTMSLPYRCAIWLRTVTELRGEACRYSASRNIPHTTRSCTHTQSQRTRRVY